MMRRYIITILGLCFVLGSLSYSANLGQAQTNFSVTIDRVENKAFPKMELAVTVWQQNFTLSGLKQNHFAVYEGDKPENLLAEVKEEMTDTNLAISLVFDTVSPPHPTDYRAMQEFAQALVLELLSDNSSDQAEIRISTNPAVLQNFTSSKNEIIAKIRQMVIEDFEPGQNHERQLNSILNNILQNKPLGKRSIILLFGPGGESGSPGMAEIAQLAVEKQTPIYAFAFGNNPDQKYLQDLASRTKGELYSVPLVTEAPRIKEHIIKLLKNRYLLSYNSKLYQTDQISHTARVVVKLDNQQAESSTQFVFPTAQLSPTNNLTPLLQFYALVCGIIGVCLIFWSLALGRSQ